MFNVTMADIRFNDLTPKRNDNVDVDDKNNTSFIDTFSDEIWVVNNETHV
jgi:hypothetical protein